MLLRALQLTAFRNIESLLLTPGSGFNVISGDNAQGKTNLLEAIYLVGTLRSFRTNHLGEAIRHGEAQAVISARVERRGLERRYDLTLTPRGKQARLDGKAPRSVAEYFGDFNVVLFAPDDLRVPRGSPTGRRRFLDRSVFNREAAFLAEAQRYARALKARNALLRDGRADEALLEAHDEPLARAGARVLRARLRYLAEIEPLFRDAFVAITRSGLAAGLAYEAPEPLLEATREESPAAAEQAMREALSASRARDRARRQTSEGPHAHDVIFQLDGRDAKPVASQGQTRALVLAWKTAEMRLLRERLGDAPILLLDDVSSELDATRNQYLFEFLRGIDCQCFVTTTHAKHVLISENRQDYQTVNGALLP